MMHSTRYFFDNDEKGKFDKHTSEYFDFLFVHKRNDVPFKREFLFIQRAVFDGQQRKITKWVEQERDDPKETDDFPESVNGLVMSEGEMLG